MPASTSAVTCSRLLVAGPSVQTILARRVMAQTLSAWEGSRRSHPCERSHPTHGCAVQRLLGSAGGPPPPATPAASGLEFALVGSCRTPGARARPLELARQR